jgi:hypothetical protein
MQKKEDRIISYFLFTSLASMLILSLLAIVVSNDVYAADTFTIEAKIDLTKIVNPEKLKVVAFANDETKTTNIDIDEKNSKVVTVPFSFNKKNDVVTVGHNDEYFVCAYNLESKTGFMKSFACHEGDIANPDGINTIGLDSFQTVGTEESNTKNVKIDILIPLYDKKGVKEIKVLAMEKGEFISKAIEAGKLLEKSKGDTIKASFTFDRKTGIGETQMGDMYFACVSSNELNPPEGTECEHRHIKSFETPNSIFAR